MSEQKPRLKRDWEGRYVRLLVPMETKGGTLFEAGEVMRVFGNRSGLGLESPYHCPVCTRGHKHIIMRVPERDVELLPLNYEPVAEPPIGQQFADARTVARALQILLIRGKFIHRSNCDCPYCQDVRLALAVAEKRGWLEDEL